MSAEPKGPALVGEDPILAKPADVPPPAPDPPKQPQPQPLWEVIGESSPTDIERRLRDDAASIIKKHDATSSQYCCLGILDNTTSLDTYELDRVFEALKAQNGDRSKDVLLVLLNGGGSIEAGYQISKLCKAYAEERFIVLVPRAAKSAATLLAIGADEIHLGPLGQLGPIDPQLGPLPALGVSQALKSIAQLAEDYPGSADMFARYLARALTVEQIGYCERIPESAAQYAERLLSTKKNLPHSARDIAHELVHEYKDHGFVIDLAEAREHLGDNWVLTDTPELALAEDIYQLFEQANLLFGLLRKEFYATIVGRLDQATVSRRRTS